MSDWQPIETAPKDQTILLYRPDPIGGKGRVTLGRYDEDDFSRRGSKPFWKSYYGGLGKTYDRANPPTHWMPFPDPPVQP